MSSVLLLKHQNQVGQIFHLLSVLFVDEKHQQISKCLHVLVSNIMFVSVIPLYLSELHQTHMRETINDAEKSTSDNDYRHSEFTNRYRTHTFAITNFNDVAGATLTAEMLCFIAFFFFFNTSCKAVTNWLVDTSIITINPITSEVCASVDGRLGEEEEATETKREDPQLALALWTAKVGITGLQFKHYSSVGKCSLKSMRPISYPCVQYCCWKWQFFRNTSNSWFK